METRLVFQKKTSYKLRNRHVCKHLIVINIFQNSIFNKQDGNISEKKFLSRSYFL